MCLWKVLEQWLCQKTTGVYPQSKASTANKSQPLSDEAALKAQVDNCLHAHSFLVKAANFASIHKGPQLQYLLGLLKFSYASQLCEAAEKFNTHSRLKVQNLNANQFLFHEVQAMHGVFSFLPLQTMHTARYLLVITGCAGEVSALSQAAGLLPREP